MNIREDIMTPNERMAALGDGKPTDRIVCIPMVASNAAPLIGRTIKEFQIDPEVMAYSLIEAYRIFKSDSVGICSNCSTLAEAMGAELYFPENDAASCRQPVIIEKKDIDKVKVATEKDGKLWVFYKAAEICLREVGAEVMPTISVNGPFSTAATLRGVEVFARDTYSDPKFCHELLSMSLESAKNHVKAIVKSGVAVGAICDPIASASMISPRTFSKFAAPYIRELVDFIKEQGHSTGIHICGKVGPILDQIIELGGSFISLDQMDLAVAKDIIKDKALIVGNISTTDEMLFGPAERIHQSCIKAMDTMRDFGGKYVLATSCDTSPNTPWENIQAMMDIARSYGLDYYGKYEGK